MTELGSKDPLWNVEAEAASIGAMLLDPSCVDESLAIAAPSDYWRADHQAIAEAISELKNAGKPTDAVAVDDWLRHREKPIGYAAIGEIMATTPSVTNFAYYAGIVHQKALMRAGVEACEKSIADAQSGLVGADEFLDTLEARVFAINNATAQGDTMALIKPLHEAFDRIMRRRSLAPGECVGLPTGFMDLDDMNDGMMGGTLIIVAGRPGMGKTIYGLNVADHVSTARNSPVLFASMEMSALELSERLLASRSGVFTDKIRSGDLSDYDVRLLTQARAELDATSRLLIDETPNRSASQIAANARRIKSRTGLSLVVIDYVQLLADEAGKKFGNRQETVSATSRRLKIAAKELDVPILALCQINRNAESREDHRPILADLRESGSLEQDADVVIFVHRPDYYDKNDRPGVAELIVRKNRSGNTATIEVEAQLNRARFQNY